jgi:hypothetical protein
MVGKVLTGNGITAYGDGHDSLICGDELSDAERDERFGEVRGSPMRPGPLRVMRCVAVAQQIPHQRALEVDHIVPKNQGGSEAITNLQARWRAAAGCCWRTGWRSRGDTWWARWPQLSR